MSKRRYTSEQIIDLLREVDVKVFQGKNVGQICREIGIAEQTYYRWCKEYGGMKTFQVKRLKELEREYNTFRPHSSLNYRPPAPEAYLN